jgi:HEAT repeats
MRTLRLAVAILAFVPRPAPAADPKPGDEGTPEYQKASELIRDLGHARFAVREAAGRRLLEMGGAAVPALHAGTGSKDAEVRARCMALIPQARVVEWTRRGDAYRADTDGKHKHDLPLLADWERLTGPPDAGSRALFADVLRAEGDFLEVVAADRRRACARCAARCQAVLERVQGPKGQFPADAGELVAMLFVDAMDPVWLGLPSPPMPAELLRNPALADALSAPATGPAIGRLLAKWVGAHPEIDPRPRAEFADLARRKPFREAAPALIELANDANTRYPVIRRLAIEALGAVGGRDAATALAELVPEGNDYYTRAWERNRTVGDQALAASLILHGKKPEDFGLRAVSSSMSRPWGNEYIPVTTYEFPTAEARDEALRRWQDEVVGKDGVKK